MEIVTTCVGAFLGFVVHGETSGDLNGPSGEFPEVVFEF